MKKEIKILLLSFAVGFIISCGLEKIDTEPLETPKRISFSPLNFIFKGQTDNSGDCLGIDIYYKIYNNESEAENDKNTILTKQDAVNSSPGSIVKSYLLASSGLNYQKIYSADSHIHESPVLQKPLYTPIIDKFISVHFYGTTKEPVLEITYEPTNTIELSAIIQRNIYKGNKYLLFSEKPVSSDIDFSANVNPTNPNTYYIQFFAAAYGIYSDPNLPTFLLDRYSQVEFLGRIEHTID